MSKQRNLKAAAGIQNVHDILAETRALQEDLKALSSPVRKRSRRKNRKSSGHRDTIEVYEVPVFEAETTTAPVEKLEAVVVVESPKKEEGDVDVFDFESEKARIQLNPLAFIPSEEPRKELLSAQQETLAKELDKMEKVEQSKEAILQYQQVGV